MKRYPLAPHDLLPELEIGLVRCRLSHPISPLTDGWDLVKVAGRKRIGLKGRLGQRSNIDRPDGPFELIEPVVSIPGISMGLHGFAEAVGDKEKACYAVERDQRLSAARIAAGRACCALLVAKLSRGVVAGTGIPWRGCYGNHLPNWLIILTPGRTGMVWYIPIAKVMAMKMIAERLNGTAFYKGEGIRLIVGDSRRALAHFEDGYFQSCITSPPYWSLRDYGIDGQIGAEDSLDRYIADLVAIFREVHRTLRDDGTLWLNIGDAYTSGNRTWRAPDKKNTGRAMSYRPPTPEGLKPKDLIGIPWRLAFALQSDGWYLRSDIIWHKPNCQPESVKDRPTRAHEYVFLFSKSEDYYYDFESIKEQTSDGSASRNRRSVWSLHTRGFHGAHFAVFPPELVDLCLQASSRPGSIVLDPFLGTGTVAEVCIENNRQCVGIELNPEYAEMALQRLSGVQRRLIV